jgi:SAM-dependent methyltransferase
LEETTRRSDRADFDENKNNPRTRGFWLKRHTGDSTPYQFPVKPVRLVKEWPEGPPPFSAQDFSRMDPTADKAFYALPRLLYHIDEPAVAALTQFYRRTIKPGSDILDVCSSWMSHYPTEFPSTMRTICATGMSGAELRFNDQLTGGYRVADLNESPVLPYDNDSFDGVTCVVSIDYLIHPIEVLKEVHRVLRPGGSVIVSQSNRCFPTKAVQMWLPMNDRQRLELINGYFRYAGGFVEPRQAYDITADVPGGGYRDPMYVVVAVKAG